MPDLQAQPRLRREMLAYAGNMVTAGVRTRAGRRKT